MSRERRDTRADLHRRVRSVTGRVVLTLAGISFAVSGVALTDLAMAHGLPWVLAPTLPLVLDGLAVSGGLMVLSRTLDGDKAGYGRFLIFLGTSGSVLGNVLHASTQQGAEVTAQVIAGAFPVAMLVAFEGFLKELKRTAEKTPTPAASTDVSTLDTTIHERVQAAVSTLAEDLRDHLDTALEGQRVHLDEQLVPTPVDADTIARQVDAHVDTAVREALPSLARQVSTQLAAELEALQGHPSTTVERLADQHRELRGRNDVDLTAALDAAWATNPDPDAWSKRTLADAAGCSPSRAQSYLKTKRDTLDTPADTTTQSVHPAGVTS